jgi:hypothetical protein
MAGGAVMSLTVKDDGKGGNFQPAPQGTHLALCYLMADLGIQETPFGPKPQVYIGWELPGCPIERDGKSLPQMIGGFYNLSMNEKANLRHMLESWRGKPFSDEEIAKGVRITSVVGKACLVTVMHKQNQKGQMRARIANVTGVPMGMAVPAMVNKPVVFDRDTGKGLHDLPEWLQKLVRSEPTTAPDAGAAGRAGELDAEDIPF